MIWGAMSSNGVGLICKIEDNLNQHSYIKILDKALLVIIEKIEKDDEKVIFCQDNASCQKASFVLKWLKTKSINVLDFPAKSPDLNPIETLWAIIKIKLNQFDNPPEGILELWERVQQVWNEIDNKTCKKLIESVPERIKAVLKSKGRWTKF